MILGRGNCHVNLSLGPGVNLKNYKNTFVKFPNSSQGVWGSWLQLTSAKSFVPLPANTPAFYLRSSSFAG